MEVIPTNTVATIPQGKAQQTITDERCSNFISRTPILNHITTIVAKQPALPLWLLYERRPIWD